MFFVAFVAFAPLAVFADDSPQFVPGLLPNAPGKEIRVRELKPARRAPLLRSTAEELPAYWNSASNGWVTSVKHQHDLGNCWAFATLATIETQLLKSGRGEYDFSEKNLAKLCGMEEGYYGQGAYSYTPAGYLLRWSGPVAEEKDPYVGTKDAWPSANSPALPSELHVQDVVWIPALDGTGESRAALKRAILDYGAIATSMYWSYSCACSNYAYHCYTYGASANHAVTIVGWDDNLPKELFRDPPESDGAWIIKNSWGTGIGEGGGSATSPIVTPVSQEVMARYICLPRKVHRRTTPSMVMPSPGRTTIHPSRMKAVSRSSTATSRPLSLPRRPARAWLPSACGRRSIPTSTKSPSTPMSFATRRRGGMRLCPAIIPQKRTERSIPPRIRWKAAPAR